MHIASPPSRPAGSPDWQFQRSPCLSLSAVTWVWRSRSSGQYFVQLFYTAQSLDRIAQRRPDGSRADSSPAVPSPHCPQSSRSRVVTRNFLARNIVCVMFQVFSCRTEPEISFWHTIGLADLQRQAIKDFTGDTGDWGHFVCACHEAEIACAAKRRNNTRRPGVS
jgi:hypothetical protein